MCHSFCCETAQVRPFLVEKFFTRQIVKIIQSKTTARKIRYVLARITGIQSLPIEHSVLLNKC